MTDHDQADDRHAAIYARVSTKNQDLRSQTKDLESWANGWANEPKVWYRDHFTGTTLDRPAWNQLWNAALAGRVARIVVWRIDRLGRTNVGLAQLFEDLQARGIGLVSLRDGIHGLDTPTGRLIAGVITNVSVYDQEVRSERQRAGIDAAKAAGLKFGRPKGTGRAISLTAEKVALVRRLKAEGSKVASIARMVGISRQSVYDAVRGV